MKERIITLLLSMALIFTCVPVMNTASLAAEEQVDIYQNGVPVSTVTLPQSSVIRLDAVSAGADYQWQIQYGTGWIDIEGATLNTLQLTYAMVAHLLNGNTTAIRYINSGSDLVSNAVIVTVIQDQIIPAPQIPTPDGTGAGEEQPETVTYTVIHQQQNTDGMTYAEINREQIVGIPGTTVDSNLAKELPGFFARGYDTSTVIDAAGNTVVNIYYDRYYYLMNLELVGGQGEAAAYAAYGAAFTVSNPTKEGFTFNGWSQNLPLTMPINGGSAAANWTEVKIGAITVNFWYENINTGEYTQVGQHIVTEAKIGDILSSSQYADVDFIGKDDVNFKYDATKEEQIEVTEKIAQLNVYYTRNKYQIIFLDTTISPGGNEVVKNVEIPFGAPLAEYNYAPDYQSELTEGNKFEGWYTQDGEKFVFDNAVMPSEDLILTASWKANTYLVTFYRSFEDYAIGGMPLLDPQVVEHGQLAITPANPLDEDYTFLGWYTRVENREIKYDFTNKVTSDIDLYAKWELTIKNASVSVIHYIQNVDGYGYTEYHREVDPMGVVGEDYSVRPIEIDGFVFNPNAQGTLMGAKLTKHGLQLQLYYDRNLYPYEVQFVDYDTQTVVKKSILGQALFGSQIAVNAEMIDGYTLLAENTKIINIRNTDNNPAANVVVFYYQENSALIMYQIVGPDGCAELSLNNESVKILTGTAIGSMPIYTEQYKFIGWYTDAACTIPVSNFLVDANGQLTPQVGHDGKYSDCIYYAKFEFNRTDLTIYKTGVSTINEEQSFIYNIRGNAGDRLTGDISLTVVIHIGAGMNSGSVTIKDLPVGNYTIKEQSDWSWRYVSVGNSDTVYLYPDTLNTIQSTSQRTVVQWLSCAVYYMKQFQS